MESDTVIVSESIDRLRGMTPEQIRAQLSKLMSFGRNWIQELSEAVGVCHEMDIDISDLVPPATREICLRIHGGQLLPEIYNKNFDYQTFRRISTINIQDQRHIADGKPLKVVTGATENGIDFRLVTVEAMTSEQKKLVFANGRIRTPEEQFEIINKKKPEKPITISGELTAAQHAKLMRAARNAKTGYWRLILNAMEAAELI